MSDSTMEKIISAVERAVREDYPEDGLQIYLKDLVVEGYRKEIVDSLLVVLKESGDSDVRSNVLTIIYFLHATLGSFKVPGMRDPRPENAKASEPITKEQLEALAQAALAEEDSSLWDSYCSLFSNLADIVEIPPGTKLLVSAFATKFMVEGDESARSRCSSLKKRISKPRRGYF